MINFIFSSRGLTFCSSCVYIDNTVQKSQYARGSRHGLLYQSFGYESPELIWCVFRPSGLYFILNLTRLIYFQTLIRIKHKRTIKENASLCFLVTIFRTIALKDNNQKVGNTYPLIYEMQ